MPPLARSPSGARGSANQPDERRPAPRRPARRPVCPPVRPPAGPTAHPSARRPARPHARPPAGRYDRQDVRATDRRDVIYPASHALAHPAARPAITDPYTRLHTTQLSHPLPHFVRSGAAPLIISATCRTTPRLSLHPSFSPSPSLHPPPPPPPPSSLSRPLTGVNKSSLGAAGRAYRPAGRRAVQCSAAQR